MYEQWVKGWSLVTVQHCEFCAMGLDVVGCTKLLQDLLSITGQQRTRESSWLPVWQYVSGTLSHTLPKTKQYHQEVNVDRPQSVTVPFFSRIEEAVSNLGKNPRE